VRREHEGQPVGDRVAVEHELRAVRERVLPCRSSQSTLGRPGSRGREGARAGCGVHVRKEPVLQLALIR